MRKLWDFHGGVHPPENKTQSTQSAIRQIPVPEVFTLPLNQHKGAPAKPVVKVGQTVSKGEMIAADQGPISAALHAPTSGSVIAIEDRPIPHPSGMTDTCIILEADGEDRWASLEASENYKSLTVSEVLARVRKAGIAGMGGAGFPTEVKLHPPADDKVNSLILNGAECEPYITADDLLMQERASEIIKGLEIMAYVLEPEEALIGIEDNKPKAIAAMQKAAADTKIEIVVIPTKYPSGGEKQLIKILTGLEVPHGKIPADIGIMCQNVATAAAVYRAIRHGEPQISRITTVAGHAVPHCGNYEVLIGTPMAHLLRHAGLKIDPDKVSSAKQISAQSPTLHSAQASIKRLIMGGPMMGFTLPDVDLPVIKTTNCLLAAAADEFPYPALEQACIRCGLCAEVCPAELLPQQLLWYAKSEEFDKAQMYNLSDCIECGACSYVCPSNIPLVQYYRFAKHQIRIAKAEQEKSDQARERFEFRKLRLAREQQEKTAKRKARAEAAAQAQAAKVSQQSLKGVTQETSTNTASARQAEIAAAVQRTQAKRQRTNSVPFSEAQSARGHTLQELRSNVDQARSKLEKIKNNLVEAEANNNPIVEKLTRAVTKNQQRLAASLAALKQAEQFSMTENPTRPGGDDIDSMSAADTVADIKQLPGPESDNKPDADVEKLRQNMAKAEEKLTMMQGMLEDARQSGDADKVAKFERAVSKNEQRLASAKQALEDTSPVASHLS